MGVGSLQRPVLPPPSSSARQQGPRLCTSRGLHVRVNSRPASGKLPLSLYVCTQTLYFSSVRHCLANCLCHCTSVHRLCTSVRHCLANCLCHCTSVHRSHTSFSAALSGKLPLSLYVCTQTLYFSSVRHCLANCLCHCISVHRPCASLQCGIVWQTILCHCISVHRPCASLQCDIDWQTAFVTVHLYTDLTHLLVRHCLANCLCHCTSVYRPCTSFRVQHCLANCLCHCTSVHRSLTSFGCSIVWQTAFVTVHLYTDLSHLFSAALSGKLPLSLYICT